MKKLRLTKQFTFDMAHALPLYQGKCRNIHGHTYKLHVTVQAIGEPGPDGMVLDFSAIKQIVEQQIVLPFDHALVLPRKQDSATDAPDSLGGYAAKLILLPFQPTTENLLFHFAELLEGKLPDGVQLYSLKLYETETSCAELLLM